MNNVGIFVAGIAISIPAAIGIIGLLIAAVSDGRENSRAQEQWDPDASDSKPS